MKSGDIDGTIDDVQVLRAATDRRAAQFNAVDVIDPDGVTTTLRNIRAQPIVAAHITIGAAGRFYLYNVAGFRGIHGFRPVVGKPVFDFPKTPAWACLAVAVANMIWIAWRTLAGGGLPMMALAPFMLACLFYAALRRTAAEAGARVMDDPRPVIIPGQPAPDAAAPGLMERATRSN